MAEEQSEGGGAAAVGGGGDPHAYHRFSMHKGKSCKGCLYFSSVRKNADRNPLCYGISRTLHQVPGYFVGETEMEAMKEGRNLADFKYACVGYSVFLDNKDNSDENKETRPELPFCAGLELLIDRRATADHAPSQHAPVHIQHKEDGVAPTRPRRHNPTHSSSEEFFGRFTRNASLVASGVARNLSRMANYVKASVDDILYPYRRRPK